MTRPPRSPSRRRFLSGSTSLFAACTPFASSALLAASGLAASSRALAALPEARSLAFDHTHTGERIDLVYAVGERVVPQALTILNRFLRDHYSGEVGIIDPALFDLLYGLRQALATEQPFEVISGYRSASTNASLRKTRGGGVARRSLHMDGMAIDIRLDGVALEDLRDAAVSLRCGGVGFYPAERFVHVDTGRVRAW